MEEPDLSRVLEDLPFTPLQVESIGQALAVIRQECRDYAKREFDKLMREVGQLRAELEVANRLLKDLKK